MLPLWENMKVFDLIKTGKKYNSEVTKTYKEVISECAGIRTSFPTTFPNEVTFTLLWVMIQLNPQHRLYIYSSL
jgi:regulatory protein YycH of two-component signal transduction system YycFG